VLGQSLGSTRVTCIGAKLFCSMCLVQPYALRDGKAGGQREVRCCCGGCTGPDLVARSHAAAAAVRIPLCRQAHDTAQGSLV
jgi:hypothetical protein